MRNHLRALLAPLALGLLAATGVPQAAHGAPDIPVGEVEGSVALTVHGDTLAWIEYEETVVLRRPDGRTQRFADANRTEELSLGRDARGRLVLVYPICATTRRCVLRRVDVRTGRRRTVAGIRGRISYPVLRRGVLAWVQGDGVGGVRTRALAGGPVRSQWVGRDLGVSGLDHDGRRLVVTGVTTSCCGQEDFDLRAVTLGSRRVRVLRSVTRGEDYRAMHTPELTGDGAVDVADADTEETAAVITRVPLDKPRRRTVRYFGMGFTTFARGGGQLAYVEAPSYLGCGSLIDPEDDDAGLVFGGCRIVRVGADPFGDDERTLPAELLSGKAVAEPGGGFRVGGQLRQRVFRNERKAAGR